MTYLAHLGDILPFDVRVFPDKIGTSDIDRKLTFRLLVKPLLPT